jgi:predicted nucleotidyltransferase component of viral defense system
MLEYIKTLLQEKETASAVFKRNLVKEYLQVLVLSFLYSHKEYRTLIFYGGSSLHHCYHLPRLSEDLDFVDVEKKINLHKLAEDLVHFFTRKYGVRIGAKVQKFRCTLKYPLLHLLDLAMPQESNYLFTKIEVYSEFDFCKGYHVEIKPVFKFGEALLIRTFNLSTLMATKIRAIMRRKWEKTTKNGRVLAEVKGRDYYDLMWYLERGIKPNMNCIEDMADESTLYEELIELVKKVNPRSIKYDLEGLIEDPGFVDALKDNIKEILISSLSRRLTR